MKKQSNTNRKPNEAHEYFRLTYQEDGAEVRALFTAAELRRPKERAARQPEEFAGAPQLGILTRIRKAIARVLPLAALALLLTGCGTTVTQIAQSAGEKNVNITGYMMYGVVETNSADTATPQGKLIIGDVTYKSRKVGIPATQKVPNTGYYKHTKRKTLFGTEETVTEFDWTAATPNEAKEIQKALQEQAAKDAEVAAEK